MATGCHRDEVKNGLGDSLGCRRLSHPGDEGKLTLAFDAVVLGLVDDEGIEEVLWTFALVDTERNEIASETQQMREAQPERTEVFVQGERPRELDIDVSLIDVTKTTYCG